MEPGMPRALRHRCDVVSAVLQNTIDGAEQGLHSHVRSGLGANVSSGCSIR